MEERVESKRHLLEAIDQNKNELIKLSSDLISFPTVSPPGRNSAQAQNYIQSYLENIGFSISRWEEYSGDPNLIGVRKGTNPQRYKSLIINGHVDVAEIGDIKEWSFDPFKPFVDNARLHGRGAADMKAGLAACMFAAKVLKDAGTELKGDLIFHSVTGEEAGEGITLKCLEHGPRADFAIVADTSDLKIQGQGGVITGWITIQSPTIHHDGVRSKMIHAGGNLFAASAIEKMVKVIQGLQELEHFWAVNKFYEGFLPGSNTINPAVIQGGRNAAFIADQCGLWITVHYYPDEDHDQICIEIEEHILNVASGDPWLKRYPPKFRWGGKSMLEERGEIFPPLKLDREAVPIKLLINTHKSIIGQNPEVGMSPSVSDAGWFGQAGVPAVLYGPGDITLAHAVNESVYLKQLIAYAKILAVFIVSWCNLKK